MVLGAVGGKVGGVDTLWSRGGFARVVGCTWWRLHCGGYTVARWLGGGVARLQNGA